jgi:hypothetical protein
MKYSLLLERRVHGRDRCSRVYSQCRGKEEDYLLLEGDK